MIVFHFFRPQIIVQLSFHRTFSNAGHVALLALQGPDECHSCKHAQDGPYCVPECPLPKYPNESHACEPCHENCEAGCTGPGNSVGWGACNSCSLVRLSAAGELMHCLPVDADCGLGNFKGMIPSRAQIPGIGKVVGGAAQIVSLPYRNNKQAII